ncbi:MAG: acyl-CoA thioesterase-1 [Paraglaciecola sp.]|jgi:acyl-CoA thioesterase-1
MRILIFAFILTFVACRKSDEPMVQTPPPSTPAVVTTKTVSYLALGDSYTIGQSVNEPDRFPVQFITQLKSTIDTIEFEDAQIIATTGWRTDQLQDAIEAADLQDTFDLVSLLIGVNNTFQNRPIEVYKTEFTELLTRSVELAGGEKDHVFVLSIPDYAFTPYGQNANPNQISQDIDEFNEANKEITEMMDVRYFDITPISRNGVDEPELVASDNLHPSGEQYRRWVDLFFEEIKALVE